LDTAQKVSAIVASARDALARGDVAATEQLCQTLIATTPGDGRAWSLLAETALRRNRPDAAIICAERAATLSPRDPIAHVMRARCLLISGDAGGARKAAELAAAVGTASPEVDEALGAIFGSLGSHGRALELFRSALLVRPDNAHLLYNLAATERMIGEFEAAETHCDQAISLDPSFCQAYYLRADLRSQTIERNHIEQMESLVAEGLPDWRGEVFVRYALGKECEDLEQHARAFHHYKAGADLQRRHLQYDLSSDIALIEEIIGRHSADAIRSGLSGFDGEQPIFIVGLPRSGTTLVERIITRLGSVVSAGELGAFSLTLSRQMARNGGDASLSMSPARWLSLDPEMLGRSYIAAARATGIQPRVRFIDKFPGNFLFCGLIHRALPRAKIIVLRRDPMDSCFAIYKTLFQGTYPFSYDLDELGGYFSAFSRLMDHWKATLPGTVLLEVAYEGIVRDLPNGARSLLRFLDLPWDDAVLRFYENSAPSATASAVQIRRPLYTSSIGKWRHFAAELTPLRTALIRSGIYQDQATLQGPNRDEPPCPGL
jgi:tetratricopeptide (TPR) repeat protein